MNDIAAIAGIVFAFWFGMALGYLIHCRQ